MEFDLNKLFPCGIFKINDQLYWYMGFITICKCKNGVIIRVIQKNIGLVNSVTL